MKINDFALPEAQLMKAIESNDVTKVTNIIREDAYNYKDNFLKLSVGLHTPLEYVLFYHEDDDDGNDKEPTQVKLITALLETQEIEKRQALLEIQCSVFGEYQYKAPLHIAASIGHAELIKTILETDGVYKQSILENKSGSELYGNITGDRQTAMHYAVIGGHTNVITTILKTEGIDKQRILLATDKDGKTPMHHAVTNNHEPTVLTTLLETQGINKTEVLQAKDKNGKTPLDYALEDTRIDAVNALLAHGAAPKLSQVLCSIFSAEISTRDMFVNYASSTAQSVVATVKEALEPIIKHLPTYRAMESDVGITASAAHSK